MKNSNIVLKKILDKSGGAFEEGIEIARHSHQPGDGGIEQLIGTFEEREGQTRRSAHSSVEGPNYQVPSYDLLPRHEVERQNI